MACVHIVRSEPSPARPPNSDNPDIFSKLLINDTLSEDFQYVRDVSSVGTPPLFGKSFPIYNLSNPDLVCGRSAFPVQNPSIATATIHAGAAVGFHVSGPYFDGDTQPYIFHEGPGQVFLSRLPDDLTDLRDYDGRGNFFKIAYVGVENATSWNLIGKLGMNFTIPLTTPPGKYLMRIEQFLVSPDKGQSQWYVNCAHVEIVGDGGGTPGPFIRFPNAYKDEDPSRWSSLSEWICTADKSRHLVSRGEY